MTKRLIPYGYRMKQGKLCLCPEEADVIREIYRLRLSGVGVYAIGKRLFEQRLPFFSDSRDKSIKKVSAILYKPIYTGSRNYPVIIDSSSYARVQQLKTSPFRQRVPSSEPTDHPEIHWQYVPSEEISRSECLLSQLLPDRSIDRTVIRDRILSLAAQKYQCIKELVNDESSD